MKRLRVLLGLLASSIAGASIAAEWQWMPNVTTAELAAAGWHVEAMGGMSWPDGRQGTVTFWRHDNYLVRCFTYFLADAQQSGDLCKHSGLSDIPPWLFDPLAGDQE
jgi:hypothetical protein